MIQERLALIQRELKAPKGQFNAFGKYKYRSCEDILEAVKPLLGDTVLTLDDELVHVGDRYYIRATATLGFAPDAISTTAWAREEADKKGMDAAQITGSVSSYARKYALNGLFLIDDTKDADTMDNAKEKKKIESPAACQTAKTVIPAQVEGDVPDFHPYAPDEYLEFSKEPPKPTSPKITDPQRKRFYAIAKGTGFSDDEIKGHLAKLGIASTHDITKDQYEGLCKWAAGEREPGDET
jgi:hypothetical protein